MDPSIIDPPLLISEGNVRFPVIVFLFLTRNGIRTSDIWQTWYEDAQAFLKDRHALDIRNYVKGVVHYSKGLSMDEIVTPAWLAGYKDPEPQPSAWGNLLQAMHRALSLGLKWHPSGTYFIYMSDTTVPLKSYSTILGSIMADDRSRADLYCDDHVGGNPKHSQWIMLNRRDADILANNTDWVHPPVSWVRGKCKTQAAASDEYWPLKALRIHSGMRIVLKINCP